VLRERLSSFMEFGKEFADKSEDLGWNLTIFRGEKVSKVALSGGKDTKAEVFGENSQEILKLSPKTTEKLHQKPANFR
jgi:hypothetical protein